MKFIIAVDCEGVAGVVGNQNKALSESSDFTFARKQATQETNACVRGLFDAGADMVVVWDSHGQGSNLLVHNLDSRCHIALGKGFPSRFPGIDTSFTGALMLGYHAMEGKQNGVLSHTYSSDAYNSIKINGCLVGEIALDASVAGELGIPLIFLASDDAGCQEALSVMPWIETVKTKKGYGKNCAVSKHPKSVEDEIYHGTIKAVARLNEMKPLAHKCPALVEIEFKKISQTIKAKVKRPDWRIKGPRTIAKVFRSFKDWQC